jgi:hypothetical protein
MWIYEFASNVMKDGEAARAASARAHDLGQVAQFLEEQIIKQPAPRRKTRKKAK